MSIKHFDVHGYVKKAKELGTSEELAEFQARQIEQAIDMAISNVEKDSLATKADLKETELTLRNELVKWVLGTGIATILAIAGLLKFMIHG